MMYNVNMRFEVPQFIEVEDKIFGPFTWKQFVYLAGGGGATVVLYLTLPLVLFAIIGIPIAALAGFLAFHQINNRPFSDFLESAINYFIGSKLYLWRKRTPQEIRAKETAPEVSTIAPEAIPATHTNNIASLARKLELKALEGKQP